MLQKNKIFLNQSNFDKSRLFMDVDSSYALLLNKEDLAFKEKDSRKQKV